MNSLIDFIWNKFTARSIAIQMVTNQYIDFITHVLVVKLGLNYTVVALILILI